MNSIEKPGWPRRKRGVGGPPMKKFFAIGARDRLPPREGAVSLASPHVYRRPALAGGGGRNATRRGTLP
jgi:hypothetical protein